MRALGLTILLLSTSLTGCASSEAKRQTAFDSNSAMLDQEFARIKEEYASRSATTTTTEERQAVSAWYQSSLADAVSRHQQESRRILREVR